MKESLIIDNVGFDVKAMSQMPLEEFVKTHMPNEAICRGKSPEVKKKWLEEAHKAIEAESKVKEEKPVDKKSVKPKPVEKPA